MASNNTKRGPNFSQKEIEKLVQLVKVNWSIVNNKETDAASNASKLDTWKEIERVFNQDETCSIYRPHYVLRTKFDNLKRLKKQKRVQNIVKLDEGSVPSLSTTWPTHDAEEDCFENFRSAIPVAKVKKISYENFDLNDSSSETVEFSEPVSGSSLRNSVTAFLPEPRKKYFIKEMDTYDDLADRENDEVKFEWHSITINDTISEAQDSCITQSTEESLSRKRKCNGSLTPSNGCNPSQFNDLQKKAFLEKHNLTLRLLKEEAEQRKKHESILQELREEEVRLRIQFLREKHEAELSLIKANLTQDKETVILKSEETILRAV